MKNNMPEGEILMVAQVWELSKGWYRERLSPDFKGRSAAEARAVFAACGLTGPFWQGE